MFMVSCTKVDRPATQRAAGPDYPKSALVATLGKDRTLAAGAGNLCGSARSPMHKLLTMPPAAQCARYVIVLHHRE